MSAGHQVRVDWLLTGQELLDCAKPPPRGFRAKWANPSGDPGLCLFTQALTAAPREVDLTGKVLEIGCAECDWLSRAYAADPTLDLYGVDWRICCRPNATIYQADVRVCEMPERFDAIVSISAIEHIGLGHYDDDPIDPDGDIVTVRNAYRWLKPGGWLYFDVPYRPDQPFTVDGTQCRLYDEDALSRRLLQPFWGEAGRIAWIGYAHGSRPSQLLSAKPTEPALGGRGFYYVACWCQKAGR